MPRGASWRRAWGAAALVALVAAFLAPGCGSDPADAEGRGLPGGGAGGRDSGARSDAGAGGGAAASSGGTLGVDQWSADGAGCAGGCDEGQVCSNGVCVTQTACAGDDDCENDTRCVVGTGCVPWGAGAYDADCGVGFPAGNFSPRVKCEFRTPPAGDPFPSHTDVQATPVVVRLGPQAPSIVAPFTATVPGGYTEDQGIVRVLRGDTCEVEANLGGGAAGYAGWLVSSASVAVADLDGDAVAEVVVRSGVGSVVAFTRKGGAWSVLWESPAGVAPVVRWAGPSIHDLDDDDVPEVIVESSVLSGANGAVLAGGAPGWVSHSQGLDPVLANLDDDPKLELTNGAAVWEWAVGAGWVQEAWFPGSSPSSPGFVGVADFGPFGAGLATTPELAVVGPGAVRIQATDGSLALAPTALPGGGGGPPTIADYDGDGLPELAVAGQAFLTVFDPDCAGTPRSGGSCGAGAACDDASGVPGPCPAGILWSRSTQDLSSNITGSSVFDFEGDGKAEVVYADECFVRVYDGTDGTVLFSQYRSSCTWYENPIVADADGDFRADLVTPSNLACSDGVSGIACQMLDAQGVDTQFPGVRCVAAADCLSGSCDAGLCRCATGADCCAAGTDAACLDEGFACAPPPPGTPGTGNTCRAAHPRGVSGIRVYADARDSWVQSRTIWNQHAYHVTHVNENGTIPRASQWQKNWLDPSLNNFRQNVPGVANGQSTPDLTAGASSFTCSGGAARLAAPVCNRGAAPVAAGIAIGFYDGSTRVCSATSTLALNPGECETVSCTWSQTGTEPRDLFMIADDAGLRQECREGNNRGIVQAVYCEPPA
ncbi:MAG: VCBS repeat-containing protein [Polyangiaceae bacterium]|nr:VCBS repeat-containing protein [Polyangiaceae bacterium]